MCCSAGAVGTSRKLLGRGLSAVHTLRQFLNCICIYAANYQPKCSKGRGQQRKANLEKLKFLDGWHEKKNQYDRENKATNNRQRFGGKSEREEEADTEIKQNTWAHSSVRGFMILKWWYC